MKQIDIIRTYAQKRCLIVDDVPDARAQLKRILIDFGVTETDMVGNAEEAIDACHKRQYDIVLSEYNLGQGKNGQQLLEELRHHNLLKYTSLYILITAENASHFVLHALEHAPDDFLQKPISRDTLRPRLDTALLKNEYLMPIKEALDEHSVKRAIAAAKDIVQHQNKFQIDVQKLLAELYLNNQQADEAEAIFTMINKEKRPIWAEYGIARVHYIRKEYTLAEQCLLGLISEQPNYIEAQDLLAKAYEMTHRPVQSQQALLNAVKISPRSALRQRELGRVSLNIEDENTSIHAYRSAIRHSKNSCQETPDDLVNLADSLVQLAKKSNEGSVRPLIAEAKAQLAIVGKRYNKHPIVMMRNKLLEAELADQDCAQELADKHTQDAVEMHSAMRYSVIGNTNIQLCIDCALSFMNRGCYDIGEAILQELVRINTSQELALKIDKLLRTPLTKEGIEFSAKLNKEGIQHYQNGNLDYAIKSFKDVLRELPNHVGLNLNLIQALLSKHKDQSLDKHELQLLDSSFQRIGQVSANASYRKRYDYVLKRYYKLKSPE